jgi:methionyl-tRNA synthetase
MSMPVSKMHFPLFFVRQQLLLFFLAPHIGHLYSSVIADTIHRFNKLKWDNNSTSIFCTGTDEHGLKISQAAEKNRTGPIDYCNLISSEYRDLAKQFNVAHTDFVRTTEERHIKAVQHFWVSISTDSNCMVGE